MTKEFVPYEQALALQELGFNEPCFKYKDNTNFRPLYQQAFRWFREKHNLKSYIAPVEYLDGNEDTYHWCIYNHFNSGNEQLTYEEGELACLKKLIEIVKNK
jgi:hypothetical protein